MSGPDALLAAPDEATLSKCYGVDAESVAVMRALADVIAPGVGGCPPASELHAHLRAAQSLEMLQRGSTTLLTRLLNMYSRAERRDARFLDLDGNSRGRVLRALAEEDLDELRDLVESVHAFILGGYIAGFSAAVPWQRPEIWNAMGFHGPAYGHLDLVAERSRTTQVSTDA